MIDKNSLKLDKIGVATAKKYRARLIFSIVIGKKNVVRFKSEIGI